MFKLVEMEDMVRIPPSLFKLPPKEAAVEVLREKYEGRILRDIGLAITILDVELDPKGVLVPGDGATYHRIRAKALVFAPEPQEVVEGEVTVVAEYGVEVRIGPLDGFIHRSQLHEKETFSYNREQAMWLGEKTGRILRRGDRVRARVVQVSYGTRGPKLRVGLTMRQPFLGKLEWIEEEIRKMEGAKGAEKKGAST